MVNDIMNLIYNIIVFYLLNDYWLTHCLNWDNDITCVMFMIDGQIITSKIVNPIK